MTIKKKGEEADATRKVIDTVKNMINEIKGPLQSRRENA